MLSYFPRINHRNRSRREGASLSREASRAVLGQGRAAGPQTTSAQGTQPCFQGVCLGMSSLSPHSRHHVLPGPCLAPQGCVVLPKSCVLVGKSASSSRDHGSH